VLFGRHIWLVAQLADRLGRRARELRAPLHFTRLPSPSYVKALDALAALAQTVARLEGLYQVALPSLRSGYANYVAHTDRLIDEPTVVILEDATREIDKMQGESVQSLEEFPALREGASPATAELRRRFAEATEMIDVRREPQSA
jgi:hypothetical protein